MTINVNDKALAVVVYAALRSVGIMATIDGASMDKEAANAVLNRLDEFRAKGLRVDIDTQEQP